MNKYASAIVNKNRGYGDYLDPAEEYYHDDQSEFKSMSYDNSMLRNNKSK